MSKYVTKYQEYIEELGNGSLFGDNNGPVTSSPFQRSVVPDFKSSAFPTRMLDNPLVNAAVESKGLTQQKDRVTFAVPKALTTSKQGIGIMLPVEFFGNHR